MKSACQQESTPLLCPVECLSSFLWLSGMFGFFTESDCRGSVLWIEAKKIHGCEWRNGTARQGI